MMRRVLPIAVLAAFALTACGSQVAGPGGGSSQPTGGTGSSASMPGTTNPKAPLRAALATVLEAPGKGVQLCLGGVAMSLPPQCGGPVIDNWDWAKAPKHEAASGVTWGEYAVIGTYDAKAGTFHLTKPVTTVEEYKGPRPRDPGASPTLGTPCAEPAGGWQVIDPATTTQASQDATLAAAAKLPTYVGAWLDQSINPADPVTEPEKMNDPTKLILNIKVTTDVAGAEKTLRKTWGGMLCVTGGGGHTEADLMKIQHALSDLPGMLSSGIDTATGTVALEVIDDTDGSVQEAMNTRFGPDLVVVTSALIPYAD